MADNRKIIIQEEDATAPRGAGVSSDVAYVPGLATTYVQDKDGNDVKYLNPGLSEDELEAAGYVFANEYDKTDTTKKLYYKLTPRNIPILFYSEDEFVATFGERPYTYTAEDEASAEGGVPHTCRAGGYDRSYIYARELLRAGLPLYYENISPADNSPVNIAEVTATLVETDDLQKTGYNTFTYFACKHTAGTAVDHAYNFQFKLPNLTSGARLIIDAVDMEGLHLEISDLTAVTSAGTDFTNFEFTREIEDTIADPENETTIKNCFIGTITSNDTNLKDITFSFAITYSYSGNEIGKECVTKIAVIENKGGAVTASNVSFGRIEYLYSNLTTALEALEDKNEYTVKYITSGGYPTFLEGKEYHTSMLSIAEARGDAVALIDHLDMPSAPHGSTIGSVFYDVNSRMQNSKGASYGAMFTPWGSYSFATVDDSKATYPTFMPASFGYLMCLASAIKTGPNWLAMAGVTRGRVPNLKSLHLDKYLSNVIAEDYQPKFGEEGTKVSINAITNIKPYGLCIWGNRTLLPVDPKGTKATNGLNTRNMTSDIKKVVYDTAKKLMFEQDSEILWTRFKAGVSGLLDQLKSGYGISDYKIIRTATKYNGQALTRGELAATIKIFPISAIEYFEVTVVLADEDVQVS